MTIHGIPFSGFIGKRKLGKTKYLYESYYNHFVNEITAEKLVKQGISVEENPIAKEVCGKWGPDGMLLNFGACIPWGPVAFSKFNKKGEPVDLTEEDIEWFLNYNHELIEEDKKSKCILQ